MSYDDWKTDPDYDERMRRRGAEAFARRMAREYERQIYRDVGDYDEPYDLEDNHD